MHGERQRKVAEALAAVGWLCVAAVAGYILLPLADVGLPADAAEAVGQIGSYGGPRPVFPWILFPTLATFAALGARMEGGSVAAFAVAALVALMFLTIASDGPLFAPGVLALAAATAMTWIKGKAA